MRYRAPVLANAPAVLAGRDVHRQWVAATNASARALLTGAGVRAAPA